MPREWYWPKIITNLVFLYLPILVLLNILFLLGFIPEEFTKVTWGINGATILFVGWITLS